VLTAFGGMMPSWHVRQMEVGGTDSSFPWSEACGLWHPTQSPAFTGVWTNLLLSFSAKSEWQPTQTAPAAPSFNRNLFCP